MKKDQDPQNEFESMTLEDIGIELEEELRIRIAALVHAIPVDIRGENKAAENIVRYALFDVLKVIFTDQESALQQLINAVCDRAVKENDWASSAEWMLYRIEDHMGELNGERRSVHEDTLVGIGDRLEFLHNRDLWNLSFLKFCIILGRHELFCMEAGSNTVRRMLDSVELGSANHFEIMLAFLAKVIPTSYAWPDDGVEVFRGKLRTMSVLLDQRRWNMVFGLMELWTNDANITDSEVENSHTDCSETGHDSLKIFEGWANESRWDGLWDTLTA